MRARRGLAALLLALAACTPAVRGTGGGAPERSMTGLVRTAGSAPMNVRVTLQPAGASSVGLAGPLAAELARLAGAQVTVRGRLDGGTLTASWYRIESVDGRPVVMGVVERAPAGGLQLRTDDGQVVLLGGAADQLRPGQKVWVQGPGQVQVQTFGVIVP